MYRKGCGDNGNRDGDGSGCPLGFEGYLFHESEGSGYGDGYEGQDGNGIGYPDGLPESIGEKGNGVGNLDDPNF